MRMLLSFAVLALTASPAMADVNFLKGEMRARFGSDGRAEQREALDRSRDAYDRAAGRPERTGSERVARDITPPVPLKAEIALRIGGGDDREGNQKQGAATTREQASKLPATYEERSRPPVPLKAEFMIKMQKGDMREGNAQTQINMQSGGAANKGVFQRDPLSVEQKEALCRQTGVCLPNNFGKSEER